MKGLLLRGTPRIPNHQPKSPIYHWLTADQTKFLLQRYQGLEHLDRVLRSLGEEPRWQELPNTQRLHTCKRCLASFSFENHCALGYGLTPLKNLLLRVEGLCNLADVYKECVIMAVFPCVCGNER